MSIGDGGGGDAAAAVAVRRPNQTITYKPSEEEPSLVAVSPLRQSPPAVHIAGKVDSQVIYVEKQNMLCVIAELGSGQPMATHYNNKAKDCMMGICKSHQKLQSAEWLVKLFNIRFNRDWKKIEAFVGSKTFIQIHSSTQEIFYEGPEEWKNGVPCYWSIESSSALLEHGNVVRSDSLSVPRNELLVQLCRLGLTGNRQDAKYFKSFVSIILACLSFIMTVESFLHYGKKVLKRPCVTTSSISSLTKSSPSKFADCFNFRWFYAGVSDDVGLAGFTMTNETTPQVRQKQGKPVRVMLDFAQVYSFIGSFFDPNASDHHFQRLKQMDPVNVDTVLMLIKNPTVNLRSPEFENHRRLISSQ
ncbi:protein REVEILLE 6-like [Forsythia ovata]|uniref:Protein REVEILLE 6-like n=1 Tax=Forsythia ovata TaxID=205694 RepID=A0ABD1QUV8_9LAMI